MYEYFCSAVVHKPRGLSGTSAKLARPMLTYARLRHIDAWGACHNVFLIFYTRHRDMPSSMKCILVQFFVLLARRPSAFTTSHRPQPQPTDRVRPLRYDPTPSLQTRQSQPADSSAKPCHHHRRRRPPKHISTSPINFYAATTIPVQHQPWLPALVLMAVSTCAAEKRKGANWIAWKGVSRVC